MRSLLVVCDEHPSFRALAARGIGLDDVAAIPECGVVLVARASSPRSQQIAAVAARAWEARAPVVLVRVFAPEERDAPSSWPPHPASAIVDLPFAEIRDARSLATALVDDANGRRHGALLDRLRCRAKATVLRVTGDARPAPFLEALLAAHGADLLGAVLRPTWLTHLKWSDVARETRDVPLLLVDQQHSMATEGLVFLSRPRLEASNALFESDLEALRRDERRYSPDVPSLVAPRALASSIAAQQLVHGRWAVTRALLGVFAEEAHARRIRDGALTPGFGVDEQRGLLSALVVRLFLWPYGHGCPAERDADDDANAIREEARLWLERLPSLGLEERLDGEHLLPGGELSGIGADEVEALRDRVRWENA